MGRRIEHSFEVLLWKFRLIAILPVVMSLLGSATTFICGTGEVFASIRLRRV